jgi:hypothetical protein
VDQGGHLPFAIPNVHWNINGIYPGVERRRSRGRYGYLTKDNALRLSEYSWQVKDYDSSGLPKAYALSHAVALDTLSRNAVPPPAKTFHLMTLSLGRGLN